jgi:hypothetical protein
MMPKTRREQKNHTISRRILPQKKIRKIDHPTTGWFKKEKLSQARNGDVTPL